MYFFLPHNIKSKINQAFGFLVIGLLIHLDYVNLSNA